MDIGRNTTDWIAKTLNVWFAENAQRRHPVRPILYMTGSSHHGLGKWLADLLQPVLERFSSHCISDSFTFAKTMQNLGIDPNVFMCLFDVSSLFTNVLLMKPSKSVQMPFTTILIYNHSELLGVL